MQNLSFLRRRFIKVRARPKVIDFCNPTRNSPGPIGSIYLSNLSQRAGVPIGSIRGLILKELVDNALDEMDRVGQPGQVTLTQDGEHTYTVTDQGRGFADSPQELAYRFSIAKPMVSSKQWRKPTRGCVGNGLRVIVASVASGGGRIKIKTRNQVVTLRPRLDGTTAIEDVKTIDWPIGAAITIEIDRNYHAHDGTLSWAKLAIELAQNSAEAFNRKPHPLWLDADHLALNMLAAIGTDRTLAWFVSQLDRCSSREVGQQITSKFGKGRLCRDLNKDEAAKLLELLQRLAATPIKPKQLGPMGRDAWKHKQLSDGYALEEGSFRTGRHEPFGRIPFLVEAWAGTFKPKSKRDDGKFFADEVYVVSVAGFTINRTPALLTATAYRAGRSRNVNLMLGSLSSELSLPQGRFQVAVNITSPYIPIVGDNKTPCLDDFEQEIVEAVQKAVRRSAHNNPPQRFSFSNDGEDDGDHQEDEEKPERIFQRSTILQVLPEAIERSGDRGYEFSQRSLYYRVRILVKGVIQAEPTYNYFCSVLTDYENEKGEIEKLIRDTRGVYVEPHGGELMPMGTVTVAAYARPAWSYSNILFLEKEDLVSALKKSGFLDRWDCFATSSKGFSTRAVRDLIDKIGSASGDEPTKFFCVHDADASGSLISQTLTKATKARAARTVEVVDLGFFPWTALSEGLLRETVERKSKYRRPVADYIKARDAANKIRNPNNEPNWESWLQNWRVELNAMTTAEFVDWMNSQFIKHGAAKVIPSEQLALQMVSETVETQLALAAEQKARAQRQAELGHLQDEMAKITEPLRKQVDKIEQEIADETKKRTADGLKKIKLAGSHAVGKIKAWLKRHNHSHWHSSIGAVGSEFISKSEDLR